MFNIIRIDKLFQIIEVSDMAKDIWHEHYKDILSLEQIDYMVSTFQSASVIENQIENDGYDYFLFEKNDVYAGYMGIKINEKDLFLSKLYIKESYRRNGIGQKAVDFLKDICEKKNLESITLTVNKYNSGAVSAYKKIGFSVVDQAVTDIGNGFVMDDYIMRLDI